jgi:hypothetical protein
MRYIVPTTSSQQWTDHYRGVRTEDNVMMARRRAIWAGQDPDLAERQYRDAIRNSNLARNKQGKKR